MSITELNNEIFADTTPAATEDGPRATWVKLRSTDDPMIAGELIDLLETERRDMQGNIVCYKKSGDPRLVWVLTFEKDGTVYKVELNESAQRALKAAIKFSGTPIQSRQENGVGSQFTLRVSHNRENNFSQATYEATHDAPADKPAQLTLGDIIADIDDSF